MALPSSSTCMALPITAMQHGGRRVLPYTEGPFVQGLDHAMLLLRWADESLCERHTASVFLARPLFVQSCMPLASSLRGCMSRRGGHHGRQLSLEWRVAQ